MQDVLDEHWRALSTKAKRRWDRGISITDLSYVQERPDSYRDAKTVTTASAEASVEAEQLTFIGRVIASSLLIVKL